MSSPRREICSIKKCLQCVAGGRVCWCSLRFPDLHHPPTPTEQRRYLKGHPTPCRAAVLRVSECDSCHIMPKYSVLTLSHLPYFYPHATAALSWNSSGQPQTCLRRFLTEYLGAEGLTYETVHELGEFLGQNKDILCDKEALRRIQTVIRQVVELTFLFGDQT